MELESLPERGQTAMWFVLRESFTEMLKGEDEEDNDTAGYVGRAMADEMIYDR